MNTTASNQLIKEERKKTPGKEREMQWGESPAQPVTPEVPNDKAKRSARKLTHFSYKQRFL